MRDISKKLSIINTGERKKTSESSVTTQYISGGGGSIGGGNFLPKPTWDKVFEIKTTENGEEYLFGKLPVALQYDLSAYVDGGFINLPSIYDGLEIDNQTIYWEEVKEEVTDESGNVVEKITKVLKAKGGSGEGTISNIYVSGEGNAVTGVSLSSDKKSLTFTKDETFATQSWVNQQDFATKTWVGENYFSINGGQLQGDLWLRSGDEYYGRTIYFGDKSYVYIKEDTDDHLLIYGSKGIDLEMSTSYYLNIVTKGVKVNGGLLTYNSSSGYWELNGDLLVNGGITSTE